MPLTKTILTILIPSCFFFVQTATAQQNITITGKVMDSLEQAPLDSARIRVIQGKNTVSSYSNNKGDFELKAALQADTIQLIIQRSGFQTWTRKLALKNKQTDLGLVFLPPQSKLMDDIVIRSRVPAVLVRNDTTEYTIDSFDRRKNAMIGELLKDLPGIEIDADGNITHNGKPVTRILVNGEDFFGGSKEMALQNLPADIVSKLQVMDTKTKEQIFNGLQSNGEDKTINIKLKPGLQAFGSASAGTGTSRQYTAGFMANVLKEKRHAAITGSGKYQSIPAMTGKGELISGTRSIGFHYRDNLSKQISMNSNGNYTRSRSSQETMRRLQQYFQADSSFISDSYGWSDYENEHRQLGVSMEYNRGKNIHSAAGINFSDGNSRSHFNTNSGITENGLLQNTNSRTGSSLANNQNLSASWSLNIKLSPKGRSISLNSRASYWKNKSTSQHASQLVFYEDGIWLREETLNQQIESSTTNQSAAVSISYMEPILKNLRMQLSQSFQWGHSRSRRDIYNQDTVHQEYQLDSSFSSEWKAVDQKSISQVSLILELKKLYLTAGVQANNNVSDRDMAGESPVQQRQRNVAPSLVANYKLSLSKSLRFNFSSAFHHPSIDQLQPVPHNSNPMFIRLGNPHLRPSVQRQFNLSYTASQSNGRTVNAGLSYHPVTNSIVHAVYYDANRRRISQYVNVDGMFQLRGNWSLGKVINRSASGNTWGMTGNASFGKQVFFDNSRMLHTRQYGIRQSVSFTTLRLQKQNRGRLTGSLSASYNRTLSPAYTRGVNSSALMITPRLEWNYRMRELIDLTFNYATAITSLDYNKTAAAPLRYKDHTFNFRIETSFSERISFGSDLGYRYHGRMPAGSANRQMWLLNVSASLRVFRNQRGSITITGMDLLNNGAELNRIVGDHFIEDVQTARQRNYFTLGFQYNWTKAFKKPAP